MNIPRVHGLRRRLALLLPLLLCLPLVPRPLAAQETPGIRSTPAGFMLDFDDQDVRVVLSALAAAAGANVVFGVTIPRKTTLRMGTPVPRDSLVGVMRAVAETNGLRVTQEGPLLRIETATPQSPLNPALQRFQQLQQQNQPPQLQLFSYRLKHAGAQDLATVLQNVFLGTSQRTFTINAGNGTLTFPAPQVLTPGGLVPGFPATPNLPGAVVQPDVTATPGAGGAAGGGGNRGAAGGGRFGGLAAQQLAQQLAQQGAGALSSVASDTRIVAEVTTNSLIVRATAQDWALIRQIIEAVDLRPLQVLIEVTIAEVTRRTDFNLGVSGTVKNSPDARGTGGTITVPNNTGTDRDLVLQLTGGGGGVDFNLAVHALAERGDVHVLALPIIIAQNNKQAVMNVGSSLPFVQITQTVPQDPTSRVQTIQYIDVGTKLTITPVINPEGYVNLTVDQTNDAATNQIQFNAPVINKREATTQVFLRDGQTTVVGGLAGRTRNRTDSGIPILSRIPLIGWIFGGTQRDEETSELFLFLTPHIVSADADIDRLRDAVRNGSVLLKQETIAPVVQPMPADTLTPPRREMSPGAPVRPDSARRPPADSAATPRRRPPGAP